MKIAVLFDGAGLARLGLEQAGHECVGVELDPEKHALSVLVGSGNCVLADATKVDLSQFDAVWASPPCQLFTSARTSGPPKSKYSGNFLDWCLQLPANVLWVENVIPQGKMPTWGIPFNAAQFLENPIQNRNRMIGGRFVSPKVFRDYKRWYKEFKICPAVTATEYMYSNRRAGRFYGRHLTLEEAAYHQGFTIPEKWYDIPDGFTRIQWRNNLYEGIGNGVPVYMAKAFGEQYC